MIIPNSPDTAAKLILSGIHLDLSEPMKSSIASKSKRLFRHDPQILRTRIEVKLDHRKGVRLFTAKGHIEIRGPDLQASVTTEDAYKSVDLLIDKLDRMLRKRTTALLSRRHADDIRVHVDLTARP